ncbi:MAG TPA: Crp/Fnr family transcriptional regulator [Tepidisphaeraceae bacterium]|nr:Crp/Fnr family transcriptional regulator [Tepidisphaeraceae bacterium]
MTAASKMSHVTYDARQNVKDGDESVGLRLFRRLDSANQEEIIASAARVRRARGERLFRQGAAAAFFYVLEEGRIKLTQLTADGQLVLVRLVVPGEAFGGVAALGQRRYPVSAEAAEDLVALSWDGRTMDRLLRKYPQLAINFIELLAERLHEMQSRYEELATEQVEQRLARMVLRLVQRVGRRVENGVLVDMRLSRQELAEMTGTSLFTVSRILNRWQEAGLIQSRRQRITILHPHGLVTIAESLPSLMKDHDGETES